MKLPPLVKLDPRLMRCSLERIPGLVDNIVLIFKRYYRIKAEKDLGYNAVNNALEKCTGGRVVM